MRSRPGPDRRTEAGGAVDVLILGGGVAGLWLTLALKNRGYSTLLLEAKALGCGQTRCAQGIIHGGTKYALGGRLTASAGAIAPMPELWGRCLRGEAEPDLRGVRLLSDCQYLWSTERLGSRLSSFLASKLMSSRVVPVPAAQRPPPFGGEGFAGDLYALREPVIDVVSLLTRLSGLAAGHIYRKPTGSQIRLATPSGPGVMVSAEGRVPLRIAAGCLILAAGEGNEGLLEGLGLSGPPMQRRPLHMVMVRGALPLLFGHCLGAGPLPRITVSSHHHSSGETVWYLGGGLAETGVGLDRTEQIARARKELQAVLPWLEWSGLRWGTVRIDRAEPRQAGGRKPADCFVRRLGNVIVAWPTKLALAPRMAEKVVRVLDSIGVEPSGCGVGSLDGLSTPPVAVAPWEEPDLWN